MKSSSYRNNFKTLSKMDRKNCDRLRTRHELPKNRKQRPLKCFLVLLKKRNRLWRTRKRLKINKNKQKTH